MTRFVHRRVSASRRALVVIAVLGALTAACGSGRSALQAGMDDPATTVAPTTMAAPPSDGSEPSSSDPTVSADTTPATIAPTTTEAPLADLPDCPTDALDDASGPVDITFWHGLANESEASLIALTDAYNASQDRVRVDLQNQTSYDSAIDKYIQSSQESRPTVVQFPEYTLQSFADSGTLIPIEACLESSGYDTSAFLQRTLDAYTFEGIRWSMPFNVSNPVLYYNRPMFEAGRSRSGGQPDHARRAPRHVADDRRQRGRDVRMGRRHRTGLGRRLVPRAVVRARGRALRRQRQRPPRPGDQGPVRRSRRASISSRSCSR